MTMASPYIGWCREIDEIRTEVTLPLSEAGFQRVAGVCRRYPPSPILEAFLADARRGIGGHMNMDATRATVASDPCPDVLIGFFDKKYYPCMGLECAVLERLPQHAHFSERYSTDIFNPVRLHDCTQGLRHPNMIALFPEHWIAPEPEPKFYKAYNFMDRFVERFFQVTLPAIEMISTKPCFAELRAPTRGEICEAAIVWIQLHEYFHTTGPLPFTKNLAAKRARSLAGLEECRVDALAALACLEEARAGVAGSALFAQFILGERLLRYPLQASPEANYDARGSQFLLGFLAAIGALRLTDGGARLDYEDGALEAGLRVCIDYLHANEQIIARCADRSPLLKHTKDFVALFDGSDPKSGSFARLPLYEHLLSEFARRGLRTEMDYGYRGPPQGITTA